MILEETIPHIFLLTPSLHAVSMGRGQRGRRGSHSHLERALWHISIRFLGGFTLTLLTPLSSLPLPPTLPPPSPSLSSPTSQVHQSKSDAAESRAKRANCPQLPRPSHPLFPLSPPPLLSEPPKPPKNHLEILLKMQVLVSYCRPADWTGKVARNQHFHKPRPSLLAHRPLQNLQPLYWLRKLQKQNVAVQVSLLTIHSLINWPPQASMTLSSKSFTLFLHRGIAEERSKRGPQDSVYRQASATSFHCSTQTPTKRAPQNPGFKAWLHLDFTQINLI